VLAEYGVFPEFSRSNLLALMWFSPPVRAAPTIRRRRSTDSGFTTTQNAALSIPASALLANDSDPDSDPLTITSASGGVNGNATFSAQTNTVTFAPIAGYTGPRLNHPLHRWMLAVFHLDPVL
jgi:hypothetical protein